MKQRAHVRHFRLMRGLPLHCTPKSSFRWIRRGAAPNSSSLLFLAPKSSSMAPMQVIFLVSVSNSSADCNFLFLISLLPKLSHPSPTALPTSTARSSRAYGARACLASSHWPRLRACPLNFGHRHWHRQQQRRQPRS